MALVFVQVSVMIYNKESLSKMMLIHERVMKTFYLRVFSHNRGNYKIFQIKGKIKLLSSAKVSIIKRMFDELGNLFYKDEKFPLNNEL